LEIQNLFSAFCNKLPFGQNSVTQDILFGALRLKSCFSEICY